MPSHKNGLKLTGDTHLPDVGDDFGGEDDIAAASDAGFEPQETRSFSARAQQAMDVINDVVPAQGTLELAREQVRTRPVAVLAGAFALGWLLARI